MKRMILIAAGIIISLASFAQLSVGIQGTGNLASAKIKDENNFDFNKKMKAMPGAGIVIQYGFNKHLAIRTGANYQQNGITLKTTIDEETNMKLKIDNSLHYVQVPVSLLYTIPLSRMKLFAGLGGYISYGVSGKSKITLTYTMPDGNEARTEEEAKAFKKEEEGGAGFKRSDYGVSGLAGIQFGRSLFANVGYQLSLANLDREKDVKYKNRGLQLTIGYFF